MNNNRKKMIIKTRAVPALMTASMMLSICPATALAADRSDIQGVIALADEENVEYRYVYAALSYAEYYAAEGVLAGASAEQAAETDTNKESDRGAFDTVSRATTNHGLHRGNFQQDVVIYDTEGNTYEMSYWDGQTTIILTDGTSIEFSRGTITMKDGTTKKMDHYEIKGVKYVPVRVKNTDYEAFCKQYKVVENGEMLAGGYGEGKLSSYKAIANVTEKTNGLKTAVMNGDGSFQFGARQTGTESGIEGQELKTARQEELGVEVVDFSKFGDFIRVDLKDNYADLGANLQTVVWKYYADGNTDRKPDAVFGTKFAADNWMHKMLGVQLGLTDSLRCKLPEGTDGTGTWVLNLQALGYADTSIQVNITKDDIHSAHVVSDTSALEMAIEKAEMLEEKDYLSSGWKSLQTELMEAKETLAMAKKSIYDTTQESVEEDTMHLNLAMDALVKRFTDVKADDWFSDSVNYVAEKKLMTGKSEGIFKPYENLARAQFAVVLYRMNGEEKVGYTEKFPDVAAGMWYTDAILWANKVDVINGYGHNGLFGVADNINREQMAVMMYRYAKYMNYDISMNADFGQYKDADSVSEFAIEAMQWAVGNGIITGKESQTKLDPQGSTSRAETAIILERFQKAFVDKK